jgi:predicted PurR-regulated permease PerM
MNGSNAGQANRNERKVRLVFLVVSAAVALYFCYLITAPFLKPILSALMIAIVCAPLHKRVRRHLHHQNAAAWVSLLLVIFLVLVPVVLLSQALHREWKTTFQSLSQQMEHSGGWLLYLSHLLEKSTRWLERFVDLSQFDLRASVLTRFEQLGSLLFTKVAGFFSNLTRFIVQTVMMFFALFFFLRDGRRMWHWVAAFSPLKPAQMQRLSESVNGTILASVYGVLAVGLAQGALLSLAFYVLGLPAPLLWGVVTACFSMVPLLGSAAIWLPASLLLLLNGNWGKGLLLLAWGAGIVAMADNVIRPLVLSESTRMHGLQTFIALLGGLQAFGMIGLFIGPVVLALTIALFQILSEERQTWGTPQLGVDSLPLSAATADLSVADKEQTQIISRGG